MSFAANIASLIRRLGEQVTLTYSSGDTFNDDTGQKTPGSDVDVSAYGAPSNYNASEIDGTAIRNGDIKLTAENVSPVPAVGWTCLLNSTLYRVESVKTIRKSGETIVYTLQLRLA